MNRHSGFLQDHVCLVTGGAGGLGWALSQAMADHGAVVHVCDISEEKLAGASAELKATPWAGRVTLTRCDVSDRHAFEEWVAGVHRVEGRVDLLVNNAAYIHWEHVTAMTVEQAERTMRVGYDAMVYGTKAVLPLMLSAGRGAIVNIGSIVGRVYLSGPAAAYAAVKAAVDAYTQTLQLELRDSPLHVMLVRPATIAGTDFFAKHVPAERLPRLADILPPMTPPEVARAIVRGLEQRVGILDIPGYNSVLQALFLVAPRLLQWVTALGGSSRSNFGSIAWKYEPRGPGRNG